MPTNNFKKVIDRPPWVQVTPAPNAHAAAGWLASDLRNDASRNPFVYQLVSNTVWNRFNIVTKGWQALPSPALAGTFGAGAGHKFVPSFGIVNTCAAGCSSTSITTTTSWGTAPGLNMLANRGGSGDFGFKIRIIGNSAGSSGKIEERWIVGNTATVNPVITLDAALSFVPATGDSYEILGGRFFLLGAGVLAAGSFKSYDVANNIMANKSIVNLPATVSTDYSAVALDEQYVPSTRRPGEGFVVGAGTYDASNSKGCLVATASAIGTLTGQASAGDAVVAANEFRNFQIRIVEDTAIPTAVGQRRIIASHTGGASPVYTLGSNWTVTPSTTAKYVIEYPNLFLLWTTGNAVTYTYNYGPSSITNGTNTIAADAWHVTYFGNRGGSMGAGCTSFAAFGIEPDTARNARNSMIYSFRGGNNTILDVLDIAGAITGTWSGTVTYDGTGPLFATGTTGVYAPYDNDGRFAYLNIYVASQLNQIWRFDLKNRVLSPYIPTDLIQGGTAAVGERMACYCAIDGTVKYSVILLQAHLSTLCVEMINLI